MHRESVTEETKLEVITLSIANDNPSRESTTYSTPTTTTSNTDLVSENTATEASSKENVGGLSKESNISNIFSNIKYVPSSGTILVTSTITAPTTTSIIESSTIETTKTTSFSTAGSTKLLNNDMHRESVTEETKLEVITLSIANDNPSRESTTYSNTEPVLSSKLTTSQIQEITSTTLSLLNDAIIKFVSSSKSTEITSTLTAPTISVSYADSNKLSESSQEIKESKKIVEKTSSISVSTPEATNSPLTSSVSNIESTKITESLQKPTNPIETFTSSIYVSTQEATTSSLASSVSLSTASNLGKFF
jgi:hypothetical protein